MIKAIAEWFCLVEKLYFFFVGEKFVTIVCGPAIFAFTFVHGRQSKCIVTIITTTVINKYVLNAGKILEWQWCAEDGGGKQENHLLYGK